MDPSKPANPKPPDIASASVPDTLAARHVNPDTGLTQAEVDVRRKENGYNEVAEKKGHPVLKFLRKFWGISAWMLELIMVLSAVLRKFSDFAVVGLLLVVNAVLSFMQEHRAAGVVEALRRRLQVSARVRRESSWHVIPARELVPGDIVRVRPGDIVPRPPGRSSNSGLGAGRARDSGRTRGSGEGCVKGPRVLGAPHPTRDTKGMNGGAANQGDWIDTIVSGNIAFRCVVCIILLGSSWGTRKKETLRFVQ
ncbi:MAG: cation-transporting P-type ATPase [Candidatus Sulfotelmatobacter sp.]|jgi:hypothetical protein